jgi:hypothetical protein
MKVGVSLSIDLKKLDLDRCPVVTKKDGTEARYLNLTTFINIAEKDQYENNGFISQSVDKEEREKGVQTPILGNVKVFFTDGAQSSPQSAPQSKAVIDEDIPF